MSDVVRVESLKSDLGVSRTVSLPRQELEEGWVRAEIERVALSTNNMTYAVYGDALGYWNLFPAVDADHGCIPVWGFAHVTESRVAEIAEGTRVFGYFPLSNELVMQPTGITTRSFVDGAAHRTGTPKVYNIYEIKPEPASPRSDSFVSIFRPLFIASYTAADFLRERNYFGAGQIVISSASSKTAYGVAHCIADDTSAVKIGLTSARNLDFVRQIGCYDQVVEYGDLASIDLGVPTLYVDLAADPELRHRVHEHFGDDLVYDCLVGSTQGVQLPDPAAPDETLSGPQPEFFFAAMQVDAYKAAGQARAFMERYERDELTFTERVADLGNPWMRLEEHDGLSAAPSVIAQLHDGTVDPAVGHIFEIRPAGAGG
ncbi:DUF2855 family protein [Nocardioides carbamazepini]|uniref:DUF2855 family protein n=1 Tax=Nocardioides carbamazepini TaxID=2854259 RepID=UPI00214A43F5|nr:DUF2855 family protein [Nocardioides carbamazepini]MCR1783225.1 DUF2855 family protein [Nocardioides carbamazepini]